MKTIGVFFSLVVATAALATPRGLLIVGTQEEVRTILGDKINVPFAVNAPNQMAAVRLTRGKLTIYEGSAVEDIIKFIGGVVTGGVAITLQAGSALWDLLEASAHTVVDIGKLALNTIVDVVSEGACLVINGVTFVVETAQGVLAFLVDLVKGLLP